jgi:hypothetical protein
MADIPTFVRRIRQRAKNIEGNVGRAVIETAIAANQAVVSATPVDTGRARANWQASIGTPIQEATDDTDQSGASTVAANNAVISRRQPDQTVFISNNVDYIETLNQGSSAQAPANFVELAVQQAISFLKRKKVV